MIQICVIGAGNWGKNHIKTCYELGVLGGVIEPNEKIQVQLKEAYPAIPFFSSLQSEGALNFPAYTVVVPAEKHFEVGKFLLEHGKHLLIEKPITLTSQTTQELIQIAHQKQLILTTGHVMLFSGAIQKIKELITQGKIGKIQYLYSNRVNLGTVRKEENTLWSFAPHDVSIFQYFLESFPERIICSGGMFLQPAIHDTTMTILHYPNNIVGHIFVSWLHPFKEHRLVVVGSKGMLSFEDSHPDKELLFYEKGIDWINGEPVKREGGIEKIDYEKTMPLSKEIQHFIDLIEKKADNCLISGEKGLEVLRILEKAEASLNHFSPVLQQSLVAVQEKKYFVHETAVVDQHVSIGEGSKIWHFSHIQSHVTIGKKCIFGQNVNIANNVKIGNYVKIQNNVAVYEGVELEDYVFCGPSMVFTNIKNPRCKYPQAESKYYLKTLVKEGASLGANSTIVCGVTIGRFAFIGAGAVVTKDVPDFAIVVGNPARMVGWMSEGGLKLQFGKDHKAYCEKSKKWYLLENNLVKEII